MNLLNENTSTQKLIIPLVKAVSINKTLNIWVCNVCSISAKTNESAKRKDYIINQIKMHWPDVIILLETNHSNDPHILSDFYDNHFTPPSENKGVVLLTKKILGCEQIAFLENRAIAVKSRVILNLVIIGIYCPYPILKPSTIEFIRKFQSNFWFVAGDFESFGKDIIEHLDLGFWGDVEFTRECNNVKTKTEYIGCFYNKPDIERLEKISDHYLLQSKFDTTWEGAHIKFPPRISRKYAFCSLLDYQSKAAIELRANWPKNNFFDVIHDLIPVIPRSFIIYKKDISLDDINRAVYSKYKKQRNEQIRITLKKALINNDAKTVASISSKILNIPRKTKSAISILGITNSDGKIAIGDDSNLIIIDFYRRLFNSSPNNNKAKGTGSIEYDENVFEKAFLKLGRKKAMSCDQFPDELLDITYIKKKLKQDFKEIVQTGNIPQYLKHGRLCLLSKEKGNAFPNIENTRPIIILSALYKLLEIYWLIFTEEKILQNISDYQIGFKKHGSTQFNICLLKKWMKNSKKSLILFVDVNKAYDHISREKLYDILSYIGIPREYTEFYINMTTNMKIFIDDSHYIDYTTGVPQGSCISPILFNLYYDKALKKLNPYSDLLLAYADDASICLTHLENLTDIQNILEKWEYDFNLKVNNNKTECILYYVKRPENLKYNVCETFKYLGTNIFNNKSQFTITFIKQQISLIAKKVKYLSFHLCPIKIKKLIVSWWFLSILLYNQISNLYLKYISVEEFSNLAMAKIKAILGINKHVKQLFVKNLLNINLENTINRMISKMNKYNPFKDLKLNEIIYNYDSTIEMEQLNKSKFWNYILSYLDIEINSFYSLFERVWWKNKEGKIKCKICNKNLSFFHLKESHENDFLFTKSSGFTWIQEICDSFDFIGSLLKRNIDKISGVVFITGIYNDAIQCKQKAIENLGIIENSYYKKKKQSLNDKNKSNIKKQGKAQFNNKLIKNITTPTTEKDKMAPKNSKGENEEDHAKEGYEEEKASKIIDTKSKKLRKNIKSKKNH